MASCSISEVSCNPNQLPCRLVLSTWLCGEGFGCLLPSTPTTSTYLLDASERRTKRWTSRYQKTCRLVQATRTRQTISVSERARAGDASLHRGKRPRRSPDDPVQRVNCAESSANACQVRLPARLLRPKRDMCVVEIAWKQVKMTA